MMLICGAGCDRLHDSRGYRHPHVLHWPNLRFLCRDLKNLELERGGVQPMRMLLG
jgi:hypothetical protein